MIGSKTGLINKGGTKMKPIIKPFDNETEAVGVGGFTFENRIDRVSVYGSLDITRDKTGLARAEELKALFDAIVAKLKSEQLPDKISVSPASVVPNPFKKKGN